MSQGLDDEFGTLVLPFADDLALGTEIDAAVPAPLVTVTDEVDQGHVNVADLAPASVVVLTHETEIERGPVAIATGQDLIQETEVAVPDDLARENAGAIAHALMNAVVIVHVLANAVTGRLRRHQSQGSLELVKVSLCYLV